MKKISVLAVLALVLVVGLAFIGCKNEPDESPELTELHVITERDMDAGNVYTYSTTIAAREYYYLRFVGKNPYADLAGCRIIIKRGATVVSDNERAFNGIPKSNYFLFNTGTFRFVEAGTFTIEVYMVDANGNKSNTKTLTITVTE